MSDLPVQREPLTAPPPVMPNVGAAGSAPTPAAPAVDPKVATPPEADQLYRVIRTAEGTAQGNGMVLYGGQSFQPGHDHPGSFGAHGPDGRPTSAAGPPQWENATWKAEKARAAAQGIDLDFSNEQHQKWATWDTGSRAYKARTGRDLGEDIRTGKADYTALGSIWQGLTAGVGPHRGYENFNEVTQSALTQIMEDIKKRGAEADKAGAQADDLRGVAHAALQRWELESDRPPQNMREAWSQWGGVAGAMAALGGLFGRNHVAALNAAGEMLQAANQADTQAYDRSYRQWKDHLDRGMRLVEVLQKEARDIVDDKQKSYDRKVAELSVLSTTLSLNQQLDPNSALNIEKTAQKAEANKRIIDLQNIDAATRNKNRDWYQTPEGEAWAKAHPKEAAAGGAPPEIALQHQSEIERSLKIGKSGQPKEMELIGPDKKVIRSGQVYTDATGTPRWLGTNEAVEVPQGAELHGKSLAGAKSGPAFIYNMLHQEHPEWSVEELTEGYAHLNVWNTIEKQFAGGVTGRNLISLNTVADHILRVEQYADALKNNQIPRANAIANTISKEFGKPEVTTFEAGRTIMADEVVRLLTSTGGTVEDRAGMQRTLSGMSSPEQFAGLFGVFKDFTGARFLAMRQEYSQGKPDREQYFNEHMLTEDGRKVFAAMKPASAGSSAAGAGGTSHDNPAVPASKKDYDALPSGTWYKDADGQVYQKK